MVSVGGDTSIATDIETVPVVAVSRTHPGSSCVVLVAPPVTQDIMVSVGGDTSIATDIETVPVVAVSRTHPGSSCVVLVAPPVTQDIMASVGGGGIQVSLQILRLFLS